MAQKNKPIQAIANLKKFIDEARKLEEKRQRTLPHSLVPPAWPAWPHLDGVNVFGSKATKELGSPEKSQKQLEKRLQELLYPYPDGNKKGKTFYQHVQSSGLLDLLLNPPLLWEIRHVWWFQVHHREEASARKNKKSEHGYDLEFHRKLMFECSSHLHRIEMLMKKHRVKKSWIEEYRKGILKKLLHEAVIYYPEPLRWPKPALQIRPHSLAVDIQLDLYDGIEAAFAKRKIKGKKIVNHKLAQQLTALLCSSHQDISTGRLDPTPEKVRNNIRDRERRPS